MKKSKRRKKIVRTEFQNVMNMLMAKAFIQIFNETNPRTTKEVIIDTTYEDVTDQKRIE